MLVNATFHPTNNLNELYHKINLFIVTGESEFIMFNIIYEFNTI